MNRHANPWSSSRSCRIKAGANPSFFHQSKGHSDGALGEPRPAQALGLTGTCGLNRHADLWSSNPNLSPQSMGNHDAMHAPKPLATRLAFACSIGCFLSGRE
jgi:hypothetical protein